MSQHHDQQRDWLPDDSPIATVLVVLVCVAVSVGLVWWPGARDRDGIAEASEPRPTHPPLTLPEPATDQGVDDWPVWPAEREVRFVARLHELAEALEAEAEVAVSSVAIERRDDGGVVVTNPPEAPVAPAELADLICSFSWDCATALRVVECESTWNTHAVGRAGERGLTQIHPVHRRRIERLGFGWDQMFDPVVNLTVAHDLWTEQGWGPWTCARRTR